ncbi:MAG: NAD(P)/FAD-dependent oxidoreductase [Pseudomonadota bacterium]
METDVVIIGAGSAGLSAAKELAKHDVSFAVLEASHRIGGRAYSESIGPDAWFDLGCAYLVIGPDVDTHIDETNPFVDFAKGRGEVMEKYTHPARYHHNRHTLNGSELAAVEQYHQDCDDIIRQSVERGEDVPISDLIDLDNRFFAPYNDMMAVTHPKDVDEGSALDFHNRVEEHINYNLQRGYGNLVGAWGRDVDVSLNTKVERIEWSAHGVSVITPKGTVKAKRLISTVSNGVLASGHIEFSPRLPDWKLDAIHGIPMGAENKIGVHFTSDVFAPEDTGYFQAWSDDEPGAYIDVNLVSTNVVTVFIGGRFSQWMEKQGQPAAREFALDRIAAIFGNDIRKSAGRSIGTAWYTDPWTLGSYSSAAPGQYHQREWMPKPIDDTLFFAGESTARMHGMCHGAYWSGKRAAHEVIAAEQ